MVHYKKTVASDSREPVAPWGGEQVTDRADVALACPLEHAARLRQPDARQAGQVVAPRQDAHVAELLKRVDVGAHLERPVQVPLLDQHPVAGDVHLVHHLRNTAPRARNFSIYKLLFITTLLCLHKNTICWQSVIIL